MLSNLPDRGAPDRPDFPAIIGAAALARGLRGRDDLAKPPWTFWEFRNFNRQCAVGFLDKTGTWDADGLNREIRDTVIRNLKPSWWRGLGYGTVVKLTADSLNPAELNGFVDAYNNIRGVSQWVIFADASRLRATGIHTWMQVYLTPVYRNILDSLTSRGFQVTTAVRGKDGLLKFLTGVSAVEGVNFPEYRERS